MTWMCLLLMVSVGCSDDRNELLLVGAEACMETRADSARWLLQQVDSTMSNRQQARYALLWTQSMHKCRIPLEGDSLINMAVDYYERMGERHLLAKSLLYKGLVHMQHGGVEDATKAFVASEQAFEGVDDKQYKSLLFNHYALLLMKQGLLDESLAYYKKSYENELSGDSVHYVVSACSQIAKIYDLKGVPDSVELYYKRGMEYVRKCRGNKRAKLFMQNYAAFLIDRKQYATAERLLKEAEEQADSTYIYNVYSSFATLYYEIGEYVRARNYGEKMLESPDSLMQCSGYLHLYRIHKRMGNLREAVHHHDHYRRYYSDLAQRRKATEVAKIPDKMKVFQLENEKRTAYCWQWVWGIGLVFVSGMAVFVVKWLGQRHGIQMKAKDSLLDEKECLLLEKQTLLQETEGKLYALKIEKGRMKGVLSRQSKAMDGIRDERKKEEAAYQESVNELRKKLKEKVEEFNADKKELEDRFRELTQRLAHSEKVEILQRDEVKGVVAQMEQYKLLQRFLMNGGSVRSVLLLIELKSGISNPRYLIKRTEYTDLLKLLAEFAHPGIQQLIETDKVLTDKQEMAYLISLGYDDTEMLCRATNLKPNSVKAYRAQVRAALKKTIYTAPAK